MIKNIAVACLIAVLTSCAYMADAKTSVPGRTRFLVNDYAGILDGNTKNSLEKELSVLKRDKKVELIISTFGSLDGMDINEFVPEYTHKWRNSFLVENDNRIHIMVFPSEKRARIGVGFGLDEIITNSVVTSTLNEVMVPEFVKGDYNTGVEKGVNLIINLLNESKLPINTMPINMKNIVMLFVISVGILSYVVVLVRQKKGS